MKIGFIGIGLMGKPMSTNILKKSGRPLMVFDLNKEKVAEMVSLGAEEASSIKEVGEKCDVVVSMVPKSEHVISVYEELLPVAKEGQIFIDMSTIDPEVSRELSKKIAEKKASMIDAPVVKSVPAAETGTLGIYVGGCKETYEKVKDILACMGNNIIYLGENGAGLVMKLCHNTLVSQIQNGVNEMITLAQKSGISVEEFMTAVSYGGAQNFYLDTKGKVIAEGNFKTAFSVENMNKDVNLTSTLVKKLGLTLPGVEVAKNVYAQAMELGYGKEDFSATYKVVSKK
ncbi:MAG: NAD(P)-dependent oxidoreductase [Fusobacterium perfoetens]|uniref:NAD(P)-dependent oxidoreductase n=1 Tax=Fusobacterium perfoetens TaxID=852 RepID=UPI0023F31CCD|nr:NAD(P)-dependent oxidoreductase [Fusobacterium perfoetens]MCI6151502.1 NAD(P)-dependent oxidoreductase [Fusobacterium perfoetens]MDY3236749.1 NAD(P)-dependent oxidoreductase [Fusobacterium perfoetens]